jgi:phosphatidate cytidylyltransferase
LLKINFDGDSQTGLRLLLYLCLIVQVNDVTVIIFQYLKKFRVADNGTKKDMETNYFSAEVLSGMLISAILGASLAWATPFTVLQSLGMAVLIAVMGTAGNLCYAAIVADRGKPGVVVVHTRPSATSRLISPCFAAPVFFHITRFYFTAAPPAVF